MTHQQEFQARLNRIAAQGYTDARRGGEWRVYLRMPGSTVERLVWSYPTEAAALNSLAGMHGAARRNHFVRREA